MAIATRKEHIRSTAQKLFRTKGFAATSMRELAREVGIEAPSLYNHYTSKQQLLQDICFDIAAQFQTTFDASIATEQSNSQKLRRAMLGHVQVIASNIEASSVFFDEWVFLEASELARFKKLRAAYQQAFRNLVADGIASGEFNAVNVKLTVFMIFSALNATYDLYKSGERLNEEEIAEGISAILFNGLERTK